MEAAEFGKEHTRKIVLIPGNMMSRHQFDPVIPLLTETYHVTAVSTDGYDGHTVFKDAASSADTLSRYIDEHLDGHIDLVFGESFGSATAVLLYQNHRSQVDSMILSGPQYFRFGPLNPVLRYIIPRNQYRLLNKVQSRHRLPFLLKLFTRSDDASLLNQFSAMAENISIETLQNCTDEGFRLYSRIDRYTPDTTAHVSVWYGAKEPNMKHALAALKKVYPSLQDYPFPGLGHGEIIAHPSLMASEIHRFMTDRP